MMRDHYLNAQWDAPKNVTALTTLRHNGFSKPPFDEFNLGDHVGDNIDDVNSNRQMLKQDLSLIDEPLWLNQTHSNTVICYNKTATKPNADAIITRTPLEICAVLTGDCLPILLCNRSGNEVAAIHAGWRGLLAGIIDNTIGDMKSPPSEILAWLGPAIGPEVFELSSEIAVDFYKNNPQNRQAFRVTASDRYYADIYELARINLIRLGVNKLFGGHHCTYNEADKFYSYRRDQGKTGRMASLIWFNNAEKE